MNLFHIMAGSLIKDALALARHDSSFFEGGVNERRDVITKRYGASYPDAPSQYLSHTTSDDLVKDMEEVTELLSEDNSSAGKNNGLLEALAEYTAQTFSMILDQFDCDFFFENMEERQRKLHHHFPGSSALHVNLREHAEGSTYQELTQGAQELLALVKKSSTIVVQTPFELKPELKREWREHFLKEEPYSFAEFQVNPSLLGGVKLFVDGKVADYSWLRKVQSLSREVTAL